MIVRISGEGQWRLPDSDRERLNELDNEIARALDSCSQDEFKSLLAKLADEVRSRGERVPDEELATSDVVLPAIDTTVEEARELFAGEGLIAD